MVKTDKNMPQFIYLYTQKCIWSTQIVVVCKQVTRYLQKMKTLIFVDTSIDTSINFSHMSSKLVRTYQCNEEKKGELQWHTYF